MSTDLTKLPFNQVTDPTADSLTEAIASPPVADGYIVVTLKAADVVGVLPHVRSFVQTLRAAGPPEPASVNRGAPKAWDFGVVIGATRG